MVYLQRSVSSATEVPTEFTELELQRSRFALGAFSERIGWPSSHEGRGDIRIKLPREHIPGMVPDRAHAVVQALMERTQQGLAVFLAPRDGVKLLLHFRREFVVNQVLEHVMEVRGDQTAAVRRDELFPLNVDVPAVAKGLQDRRVRRGPSDPKFLQALDERGLAVSARGFGLVFDERRGVDSRSIAFAEGDRLVLVRALVIPRAPPAAVRIPPQMRVPRIHHHAVARPEGEVDRLVGAVRPLVAPRPGQRDGDPVGDGVRHLRRQGPLPDQPVQAVLVRTPGEGPAVAEEVRRLRDVDRADRLVRLLGVLRAAVAPVPPRRLRPQRRVEVLRDVAADRLHRRPRDGHAVRPHVGDQAADLQRLLAAIGAALAALAAIGAALAALSALAAPLVAVGFPARPVVQPLRHGHHPRNAHSQPGVRGLLQRRCLEGGRGLPVRPLGRDVRDPQAALAAPDDPQRPRRLRLVAVRPRGQLLLVQAGEHRLGRHLRPRSWLLPAHVRDDLEPFRDFEALALQLPLHDRAEGDGLHAAGRPSVGQRAPQERGEGEPVEEVQGPPGPVGVDQVQVDRP
eukprot:CAMPEP_0114529042 /NCGR_PEP_ID=MMETSP0109-20121206/24595_1 /TAXON_ID=29199 /ORGANISM="Chlorarachnion reptans, Strain CCCM449" /LENGTH=569 /DNA_ID=CAMNT_0001711361 /DNA_START=549 /DNA_END=2253 /DNA_ORIENTATION=+